MLVVSTSVPSKTHKAYSADYAGRIWMDKDSFLAPFGHFDEDYRFVINFLRDPKIAKATFHDGMNEKVLLEMYAEYLKYGFGWIGFHNGKRAGFVILQTISWIPLVYAIHGGIDPKLYGTGRHSLKVFDFAQHYAFEEKLATKVEGYICNHSNNLLSGYFKRGGMTKECEVRDRISIDGSLYPLQIYGITNAEYHSLKEKDHGRRKQTITATTAKPLRNGTGTNKGPRGSGGKKKSRVGKRR